MVSKKIVCFFYFAFISGMALQAKPPLNYRLVWADEFNTNSVDTTSWSFETGDHGWGNNEFQLYTKSGNAEVKGGVLIITARKEGARYTSARMVTRSKRTFTYGYFEIRAKLPQGKGTWPAIWMLGQNIGEVGWPACGEIDIMEHVGRQPKRIYTTIHNVSGHGDKAYSKIYPLSDPFGTYHLYAVEWTSAQIRFYIDGKMVHRYRPAKQMADNWPFNQPQFLILNIAIGGNFGGFEVNDACLPQSMMVDYVRVYQYK